MKFPNNQCEVLDYFTDKPKKIISNAETIANDLGMEINAIRSALKRLIDKEFLKRVVLHPRTTQKYWEYGYYRNCSLAKHRKNLIWLTMR